MPKTWSPALQGSKGTPATLIWRSFARTEQHGKSEVLGRDGQEFLHTTKVVKDVQQKALDSFRCV